ncbi:oligopeptide ABC transporter substrate-binding protein [Aureibacillus halotolerans]|uniref:Peptide/nickel transport system substrate-binding protein n=1 Tax=Aureibacillus halotolerans TaxID=1508390 RepID=A0A4R6U8J4_9BACI|nr:oligopeptide ABC transporter substrate-binding protein [Aureibacillus halotolerans]TDQ42126.1 peptide/nickel transport system substrate-binding protein [Aureibacillus halotolerans]
MKGKKVWLLMLVFALVMVLAACNGGSTDNAATDETPVDGEDEGGDEEATTAPPENNVVTMAIDTNFGGIFEPAFYSNAVDADVIEFMHDSLFAYDENIQFQPYIASWETEDELTYTFTLEDGITWHNGDPLIAADWAYALETIAHPDYSGVRYSNVSHIVGADAKQSGEAETISGIEVVDDLTLKVTFKEKLVNNLLNLWDAPMPSKYYEGIPVAELPDSPKVRQEPIGFGPFKVKEVREGEYIEFEKFEDYWQGAPKLDGVIVRTYDPSVTQGAFENGEIDIMGIRAADAKAFSGIDHLTTTEVQGLSYSYVGFKLGHFDEELGRAVMDRPKFEDLELRTAMYHAINRPALLEAFLDNGGSVTNSVVPATHWIAAEPDQLTQYDYNPEKAMQILDDAGYVDVDGDGLRENPEGQPLQINFDHYDGPANFEGRAMALIQSWQDIGLNVELNGSLKEVNLYYELVENDDEQIDVYFGGWSVGADPDPSGIWRSDVAFNYPRWYSEESDALLAEALKTFDEEERKEIYVEWQQLVNEELPLLPLWTNNDYYAQNNRLQGVTYDWSGAFDDAHLWSVQ